jgi:heme oxygenase (biliverdin-IX-beta and delta-forming)
MKPNQDTTSRTTVNTANPPLVMALLRTETASAHKNLERTRHLERLFAPDYTMQEYQELIFRFYGFVSGIEPLIFGNLPESQKAILGHKTKAGLLEMDIAALDTEEIAPEAIPRCGKLPQLPTFARQMGALYVMEGSTLGGRIITKRLKEHFGPAILGKLNYYDCYGESIGSEWKAFQTFMGNQFGDGNDHINEVVSAANDTFLCLHQWLDQSGHAHEDDVTA